MSQLLLLSNSATYRGPFLEHAAETIAEVLGGRRLLFVPYALADHAGYTARVRAALSAVAGAGTEVTGLEEAHDPVAAVRAAEAVFIGGGNTFRLLKALQDRGLVPVLRDRVLAGGVPYLGSSAGTNMACPSLRTTNDMPIVQPSSFEALSLVPFQINPHYVDPDPASRHMGETREERISQFHEENDVPVLGLREGSWLRVWGDGAAGSSVTGGRAVIGGLNGARLFDRDAQPRELAAGDDLSFLLARTARFDTQNVAEL
ncbi:MAG TPA: dipeptidase PepE [Trebonia sp.]|jgi:dipeptidase E